MGFIKRYGGGQGPVDKRLTRGGVGGQNPQNMVDVISGRSLTLGVTGVGTFQQVDFWFRNQIRFLVYTSK